MGLKMCMLPIFQAYGNWTSYLCLLCYMEKNPRVFPNSEQHFKQNKVSFMCSRASLFFACHGPVTEILGIFGRGRLSFQAQSQCQ